MNHIRRAMLKSPLVYLIGMMIPLTGVSSPTVTSNNDSSCILHRDTTKKINEIYGEGVITENNLIRFDEPRKNERNGFYKRNTISTRENTHSTAIPKGNVLVPINPGRMLFHINYNPEIVRAPITFLMEEYNYWGKFKKSNYVAQFQTNGAISNIALEAKSKWGNVIVMIAISKSENSIIYTCQKVFTFGGEDGCC